MTATALPGALRPWAASLAVLEPETAIALGPLIGQLDRLVARHDPAPGPDGPLDGYDGIGRRGLPGRLLMSEWAMADAAPAEFLRRAASAELLYLAPAYQDSSPRGRVGVLVDTGIDQLGAARLVQLAMLIVLHRRAAARRRTLTVGLLADGPGSWSEATELGPVLAGWLAARRASDADPDTTREWLGTADRADDVWLLTGVRHAAQFPGRRRTLSCRECAWDGAGATAAEIMLDGDRVELALPRHDLAVAALRTAGLSVVAGPPGAAGTTGPLRHPVFTGRSRKLLVRAAPDELVSLTVPSRGHTPSRPRRHRFRGPVIAAAYIHGGRLLALVRIGRRVRAEVIGRRLDALDELDVSAAELGLGPDAADGALAPLYFGGGEVLCRLDEQWWALRPGARPESRDLAAVAPGEPTEPPRTAVRDGGRLRITGHDDLDDSDDSGLDPLPDGHGVVFGPDDMVAIETGPDWRIHGSREVVAVGGDDVIGLADLDGVPTLVTVSPQGVLVRLVSAHGSTTLTGLSGGASPPSLHPVHPWLAVHRDGRIEVHDLDASSGPDLLLTVRAGE